MEITHLAKILAKRKKLVKKPFHPRKLSKKNPKPKIRGEIEKKSIDIATDPLAGPKIEKKSSKKFKKGRIFFAFRPAPR